MPITRDTHLRLGSVLGVTPAQNVIDCIDTASETVWGDITGTIGQQTDLQVALTAQHHIKHELGGSDVVYLAQSQVTGLVDDVNCLHNVMSSGLISGLNITINATDPTKFDIGPGRGVIVDAYTDPFHPTKTVVELTQPMVGVVDPYLTTADTVYVALDANKNVIAQPYEFSNIQWRNLVVLGWTDHVNRTVIEEVAMRPNLTTNVSSQLSDLVTSINTFNVEGNRYSASTGLQIKRSAGSVYCKSQNYDNDPRNPNVITTNAEDPAEILYYFRSAGVWVNDTPAVTAIDPDHYDNGSLVATPPDKWTIQVITYYAYWGVNDIQYGQALYDTKELAIASLGSNVEMDPYNDPDVVRSFLIVKSGATDLTDPLQAEFREVSKVSNQPTPVAVGEANTSSNGGTGGVGIVLPKLGVDLPFKSISAGPNVTVTDDVVHNAVEISVPDKEDNTRDRVMVFTTTLGQTRFYIPVGCYFKDAPTEIKVEMDQGAGYGDLQYGADYSCIRRTSMLPTVGDAACGVTGFGGTIHAGWHVRLTWKERRLRFRPQVVLPVRVGDPYTGRWNEMSPTLFPDGVQVPMGSPGWAVEFWRYTPKPGGTQFLNPATGEINYHEGRRWIPYWRSAAGETTFKASTTFGATLPSRRKKFRVCYYNPTTGSRSELSNDVIVVGQTNGLVGDWANGVQRRYAGAVWIE